MAFEAGMTDPAVAVSVSHDRRIPVIADIEYRIAQSWFRIMCETFEARAGRPVGNSLSILFAFHDLAEVTKAAIDESWSYVLDICRASEVRPAEFVPQVARSIGFFAKGVFVYANGGWYRGHRDYDSRRACRRPKRRPILTDT